MKANLVSATSRQGICFKNAQAQILSTCDLQEGDYWHLEFEYGCLFVEYVIPSNQSYQDSLLMDEKRGFWSWWKYQWMLDNQQLIDAGMIGIEPYSQQKKAMCNDPLLEARLLDFLSI